MTRSIHCKHTSHSFVVGCKERGGALPSVTVLTVQGITIMCLFVVKVRKPLAANQTSIKLVSGAVQNHFESAVCTAQVYSFVKMKEKYLSCPPQV